MKDYITRRGTVDTAVPMNIFCLKAKTFCFPVKFQNVFFFFNLLNVHKVVRIFLLQIYNIQQLYHKMHIIIKN